MSDCKECERLKAENQRLTGRLQDAQADLRAVKCGHATPKEARLERELAQAKAENGKLKATVKIVTKGKTALLASEDARQSALIYSEIAGEELDRLKAENARLAAVVENCRKLVEATPVPPNAITWEQGCRLLNMLQDEVCPSVRPLLPSKETSDKPIS